MTVNDNMFGKLEYDMSWDGKARLTFLGKEIEVTLRIRGKEDALFLESQRKAYFNFLNNQKEIMDNVEKDIFKYYKSVCNDYRDMFGSNADEYAPVIHKVDELSKLVKLTHLIIDDIYDPERVILLLFKTKWDYDMGMGIMLRNETIDSVGTQDDVL